MASFLIVWLDRLCKRLTSRTPFEYFALSISARSQSTTETYLDAHFESNPLSTVCTVYFPFMPLVNLNMMRR